MGNLALGLLIGLGWKALSKFPCPKMISIVCVEQKRLSSMPLLIPFYLHSLLGSSFTCHPWCTLHFRSCVISSVATKETNKRLCHANR